MKLQGLKLLMVILVFIPFISGADHPESEGFKAINEQLCSVIDKGQHDDEKLVQVLLASGARLDYQCSAWPFSFMHMAVYHPNRLIKTVEFFLEEGISPNIKNKYDNNRTPLFYISPSFLKMPRLLLDKGANPCVPDDSGVTPISLVQGNEFELTKLFIDKGGDRCINKTDDEGDTLLTKTPFSAKRIELFLKRGAKPNHQNNAGDTALHRVVRLDIAPNTVFDAVQMLRRYGADPTLHNNTGEIPLLIALNNRDRYKDDKNKKQLWQKVVDLLVEPSTESSLTPSTDKAPQDKTQDTSIDTQTEEYKTAKNMHDRSKEAIAQAKKAYDQARLAQTQVEEAHTSGERALAIKAYNLARHTYNKATKAYENLKQEFDAFMRDNPEYTLKNPLIFQIDFNDFPELPPTANMENEPLPLFPPTD